MGLTPPCAAGAPIKPHLSFSSGLGYCVLLFAIAGTGAVRPLCLQDSPGKNTGVACHCLLQGISRLGTEPASLTSLAPTGLQSASGD